MKSENTHLGERIVKMGWGKWTDPVSLQVQALTHWEVQKLSAECNCRETVLKEIAHIQFISLTFLNLENNNLHSIEGLPNVDMPHLRSIFLYNNKITSVGLVRKAVWPCLQRLGIRWNYFGDGKRLTEGCFPKMKAFVVCGGWREKNSSFTDSSFPSKMEAHSLEILNIGGNKFCFHRYTSTVLKQRWPHIHIS